MDLKKQAQLSKRYVFIAEHRGGPLSKENHRKINKWARECVAHILYIFEGDMDILLANALDDSQKWEWGVLPTATAIKASVSAHAVARGTENEVNKAIARAIAQAVATAHMADHAAGAARYSLKAVNLVGKNVLDELNWQLNALADLNLPSLIVRNLEVILKK